MSEVTRILTAIEQGDARSTDELLPLVYHELRRLAAQKMSSEPVGHTLQPTALVHEAWLKLVDAPAQSWQNRAHFFGAAAEAMRRILIDRARRKGRQRRGSGAEHLDADALEIASPAPDDQLLALNDALDRFAALEPQQAELVTSSGLRSRRPPKSSASPKPPPNVGGPTPAPGCSTRSVHRREQNEAEACDIRLHERPDLRCANYGLKSAADGAGLRV